MLHGGFVVPARPEIIDELVRRAHVSRGDVLTATSVAASGHPGGSMSSMELMTVLYGCARLRSDEPRWAERDRIVVSHGHTSPGVYAALSHAGFFPVADWVAHFRQAGSVFEGHVERGVPGVEWSSGNLGQGLSAGVGMALGARVSGSGWRTYVAMSDGEQHKGQVAEARRLAVKEGLTDLTVLIDGNGIQISGATDDVMPVPIADDFEADGWRVVRVDGHDIASIYDALVEARTDRDKPVCIVADTVIGKGVSFMEGEPEFHGRGLRRDEYERAMAELGLPSAWDSAAALRPRPAVTRPIEHQTPAVSVVSRAPRSYAADALADNRGAWGGALEDLATANPDLPMMVLDCDLAVSVKTDGFRAAHPDRFVQCGVGEHNAATVGGALSTCDVLTFWADFGVFGVDEVYNQHRLNDINGAALKLVLTHCGVDVGEDGRTHQALDYVGSFRELFGWKVIVPSDPNQTDRAVRSACSMQGNVALAMGRSKLPTILDESGEPAFAGEYAFEYGRIDGVRHGEDICLLVMGTPTAAALEAADRLRGEGVGVCVGVVSSPLELDDEYMRRAARTCRILTVEDHNVRTGLGASVAEWLALKGEATRFVRVGVDGYQTSGTAGDLAALNGLDADGIERELRRLLGKRC